MSTETSTEPARTPYSTAPPWRRSVVYGIGSTGLRSSHLPASYLLLVPVHLLETTRASSRILPALHTSAVETLMAYHWPGNVRELENVLQRALVLCVDNQITAEDIMVDGVVGAQLSERRISKKDQQSELRA